MSPSWREPFPSTLRFFARDIGASFARSSSAIPEQHDRTLDMWIEAYFPP
jgi:hypothetical protein